MVWNYHAKLMLHLKSTSLPYLKVSYCWCWNALFLRKGTSQLTRMAWDRICNNFTIHILTFSILVIFWFLVKMHFKGLHGRQNRELMVPNSYLITGLILPGNYATFGQKGTKNNNKSLNSLCVNLEKII